MLAFLHRIFGRKDEEECQSQSDNYDNANTNQNPRYDFYRDPKNADHTGYSSTQTSAQNSTSNYSSSSSSNVFKFAQNSSAQYVQTNQKKTVILASASSFPEPKIVYIDSEIKPKTITKTFEKSIEDSLKPKVLPSSSTHTCGTNNNNNLSRGIDAVFDRIDDESRKSSLTSSKPPPLESKHPFLPTKSPPPSGDSLKPKVLPSSSTHACDATYNNPSQGAKNTFFERRDDPQLSRKSSLTSSKQHPLESERPLLPTKSPPPSDSSFPSSSFGTPPKCHLVTMNKPTLSRASCNLTTSQTKTKYVRVEKGASPLYGVPEDFEDLIKKDIVPGVLKKPLSPSTYKDYFAALLYAEDCYLEKWDGFEMENVSLKLQEAEIHNKKGKNKNVSTSEEIDDKIFVVFEIESCPKKRPFLLSRDFVYVRPSYIEVEPFKGIIYRVEKSNHVLVEFGEDFHEQHYSDRKYDVRFSFNRVCLKRAHQAIAAASDVLFKNFLFPDQMPRNNLVVSIELCSLHHKLDKEQVSAVRRILIHHGPPPFLVEGPLAYSGRFVESRTREVVQEAVLKLCEASSLNRILLCAPTNSTCDVLMTNLQNYIPESDLFRSYAAFRELNEVPDDILPFCPYEQEQERFLCPSLPELHKFRVILSTFMSTFRLHNEGVTAGHFSHIFLVDASSSIEPEALVPLTNLANEETAVIVTGEPRNCSSWVRSNIARGNGLKRSYFERLRESELYASLDPRVISQLNV